MKQYLNSLDLILKEGVQERSRTGTDRIRYHGINYRFDLSDGKLPIVTTKKVPFRIVVEELLWFLRGETNIRPLLEKDIHIWTDDALKKYNQEHPAEMTVEEFEYNVLNDEEFAEKYGELGPVYGSQWRNWNDDNVDQIKNVINEIKNNPTSSRMLVVSWNPSKIKNMTLPPCHCLFQFTVINGSLNLQVYQRSGDMFLGVPFNITSYSIMLCLFAEVTNLGRGVLTHTITDSHIYENHLESVSTQLTREPMTLPILKINNKGYNFNAYTVDDFVLEGYKHHSRIKGALSV